MQLSALSTIEVILDVCTPRINFWKETILDAVGRCWVQLIDEEQKNSIPPNGIFSVSSSEFGLSKHFIFSLHRVWTAFEVKRQSSNTTSLCQVG
jgi:hypothetical protein